MATEKICIHCVYFPLCHAIWSVCATHPCRHIGFGSVGFFRHKADEERIRRETIEECAKLCEVQVQRPAGYHGAWEGYGASMGDKTGTECAIAIRALAERNSRGNESY